MSGGYWGDGFYGSRLFGLGYWREGAAVGRLIWTIAQERPTLGLPAGGQGQAERILVNRPAVAAGEPVRAAAIRSVTGRAATSTAAAGRSQGTVILAGRAQGNSGAAGRAEALRETSGRAIPPEAETIRADADRADEGRAEVSTTTEGQAEAEGP
jgi:hypothetical protein